MADAAVTRAREDGSKLGQSRAQFDSTIFDALTFVTTSNRPRKPQHGEGRK